MKGNYFDNHGTNKTDAETCQGGIELNKGGDNHCLAGALKCICSSIISERTLLGSKPL